MIGTLLSPRAPQDSVVSVDILQLRPPGSSDKTLIMATFGLSK